jgi:hypothetical protein
MEGLVAEGGEDGGEGLAVDAPGRVVEVVGAGQPVVGGGAEADDRGPGGGETPPGVGHHLALVRLGELACLEGAGLLGAVDVVPADPVGAVGRLVDRHPAPPI